MNISNLDNCTNIGQVIDLINDEFACDASAEEIAAEYALQGVAELDDEPINKVSVEVQLDALVDDRNPPAKFDYQEALELALKGGEENV